MTTADPREAFLRRLEGGANNNLETPPTAPSTEETATANDDMIRFLKEAGLESTPIDPSSLEVLKKMVTPLKTTQQQEEQQQPRKQAAVAFDLSSSSPLPPLQEVQTNENRRLDRMASEITIGTTIVSQAPTNATVGGEEVSSSKLILQQLEMQTQMMMAMQQRIDHLTNMVHQMQGAVPVPPQGLRNNHPAPVMQPRGIRLPVPAAGARYPMTPRAPVEAAPAAQPEQPLPPPPRTMFGTLCDYITAIPGRVRESRTAEVWRVFWALHRRYVRLDGGLIFKVMLMVAVFSAKTMSRKNRKEDFWSASLKFQLVMGVVALGFLLQTGKITQS